MFLECRVSTICVYQSSGTQFSRGVLLVVPALSEGERLQSTPVVNLPRILWNPAVKVSKGEPVVYLCFDFFIFGDLSLLCDVQGVTCSEMCADCCADIRPTLGLFIMLEAFVRRRLLLSIVRVRSYG